MQCISIKSLLEEISKVRLDTLQHAAEISPLITERTIGPDLPESVHETITNCSDDGAGKSEKIPTKKDSSQLPSQKIRGTKNNLPVTPASKQGHNSSQASSNGFLKSQIQNLDIQTVHNNIMLREAEQQFRKSVRQQVIEMQEKHLASIQGSAEKKSQLKQENERWLAEKRRSDSYILAESEKEAARLKNESEMELKTLRQQTQRQLQIITFQAISQYHSRFLGKYENVARLLMSIDKQELLSCEEYNRRLKELVTAFEQLITKIKAGEYGAAELRDAERLCKSLDTLEGSIIKALENIVHQEEQRTIAAKNNEEQQRAQQELQKQMQQQKQHEAVAASAVDIPKEEALRDATTTALNSNQTQSQQTTSEQNTATNAEVRAQCVSAERFAFYTQINTLYQEKLERVKPLQSDESLKKYRSACQKAINIPVNAISAVSAEHLKDKFEKLYNFISGQPFKVAEGQMITVNDHPLARDYCLLLMAKKFVSQGDTTVSSNPQAAFPVATVVVSLWKLLPDFGHIFLAYAFKESPFLVPYFIPQKSDQSVEDYYRTLGYRVTDSQLEQQEMYLKRQAGIARLYAAVMITNGRQAEGPQHPYGIEQGWRWLTNFVSLAPLPDISATFIMEILQTVGADMWAAYGRQFVKLLLFIQQQYLPKLSEVDEGGPKTRLELTLGKILREGQIPRAQGVLPAGFW